MAIFTYNYKIKYSDVGIDNKLTLKSLVETLQEAAIGHSEQAGYGVNNMENTHIAWLLLDWKVQVMSYPHSNQFITVKTWPRVFDKLYSYRDFEVYDGENNLIAIASSKWFAVDTQSKRIKKLTPEITDAYGEPVTNSVFDEPFKNKVTAPENSKLNFSYTTQRRDIDTNGHVNNLNYIDYALETLDEKIFNNTTFKNLEIEYKKEIKLRENIKCYYTFQDNKHIITIKSEDDLTIHAIVKLY